MEKEDITKKPIAILISGRGSNMEALVQACARPDFPARIVLVLSNKTDALGLKKAQEAGIPTGVVDHNNYDTREEFEDALHEELQKSGAELVCLAGFMRILTTYFVNRWKDRLINIHPSLLPAFKGLHTHERAIEAGIKLTGCTVHFVRPEMDDGPIIIQAAVPIYSSDSPADLAKRVLKQEHIIYPEAIRLVVTGEARVRGRIVEIQKQLKAKENGAEIPTPSLIQPKPMGH